MPSFRGIEISIITSLDVRKLPEYPHPDGSSVRLVRVGAGFYDRRDESRVSSRLSPSSISTDADPALKKVNPRISVYVPSSPGAQFRLRYLVNQSPPPSRFVFFKMIINGHHTVSWGVDTNNCCAGNVTRSLFEPSDQFRDRNGEPIVGIETRYFHFTRGFDKDSAAEDGGLIEVQVFRCRGRKRIAVSLGSYPHHHQEHHGIISPSGGLVDNPQDATFYEYHLEDAKESPYATFCFHYRSMKCLEQLNVVPQHETRLRSVSMSSSIPEPREEAVHTAFSSSAHQFAFGVESLDMRVFDNDIKSVSVAISEPSEAPKLGGYSLRSPPQLSSTCPPGTVISDVEQAQKDEALSEMLQRPLPELPKTNSRQVSKGSLRSSCPSLTPSLKQYVKSDEFENEEFRLGTAQPVLIPSTSMQALELSDMNIQEQEENSLSDYTASPDSSETSTSPVLPSPAGYVPTTGSVLKHHLSQFESPIAQSSPRAETKSPTPKPTGGIGGGVNSLDADTLRVTEAEWLRQTPSPLVRESKQHKHLWSPRPEKQADRSSMVELPTRQGKSIGAEGSSDKFATRDSRASITHGTSCVNEAPIGNWI